MLHPTYRPPCSIVRNFVQRSGPFYGLKNSRDLHHPLARHLEAEAVYPGRWLGVLCNQIRRTVSRLYCFWVDPCLRSLTSYCLHEHCFTSGSVCCKVLYLCKGSVSLDQHQPELSSIRFFEYSRMKSIVFRYFCFISGNCALSSICDKVSRQ